MNASGVMPGLLRGQHDRRAVGVVGADEAHRVAGHAPRAHPDVGLDVADQVAQVQRAVGVGQGAGDGDVAGHGACGVRTGPAIIACGHGNSPALRRAVVRVNCECALARSSVARVPTCRCGRTSSLAAGHFELLAAGDELDALDLEVVPVGGLEALAAAPDAVLLLQVPQVTTCPRRACPCCSPAAFVAGGVGLVRGISTTLAAMAPFLVT